MSKAKTKLKPVESVPNPRTPSPSPLELASGLMEEAWDLKQMLNERVKDGEYDPEFHHARRYKEVKDQLALIQTEMGGECIEDGKYKFSAKLRPGRESLNKDLLTGLLLARGIPAPEIADMYGKSTKVGDPYWVKEVELKK